MQHFLETIKKNFSVEHRLGLVGTIQFVTNLQIAKQHLENHGFDVTIPQALPLSHGELLGCTCPNLCSVDKLIYLGDGRFHLESAMIANPNLPAYKYDPYDKRLTRESYDHKQMRINRRKAIDAAANAQRFGIILGTLGRQGNPAIVEELRKTIREQGKKSFVILLCEIFPSKLDLFGDSVDVWVQVACPRLSIDWGLEFSKPLLTPYEASVALGKAMAWPADIDEVEYPMDYYAYDSLGPWTPNHSVCRPAPKTFRTKAT